jgi:hypothetical protein
VDVVGNVSLGDTMCACGSDPGHDRSEITKEITVIGRQGTTGEGELARTIMGEEGVGVLQEGDQYEPMVNPVKGLVENLGWGMQMPLTRDKERDRFGRPRRIQTCRSRSTRPQAR